MTSRPKTAEPFESLTELLGSRAAEGPDRPLFSFLADGDGDVAGSDLPALSRGELMLRSRALAARLQAKGLAGSRALLLFPPGLEFLVGFFGCLHAGVVAVPAYPPRLNRPMTRLRSIAADAEPAVVLTCVSQRGLIGRWREGVPELTAREFLITDEGPGAGEVADLATGWEDPRAGRDTLAFLQYTSGSTADPKGVMITHGNLLANSALIRGLFAATQDDRGVFWLPLFHDMGLIGGVLQTLYCGGSSTLMSPVSFLQRPLRWLEAISRTGAAISGGPNFAYDLCVEKTTPGQRASLDLSRWRIAFNGAEPVRAETLDRFAEAFAPAGFRREAFLPCYGLAESTLMVAGRTLGPGWSPVLVDAGQLDRGLAAAPAGAAPSRLLVGHGGPLEDAEVVIADRETGLRCDEGRVGEILVSGPSVARGYWNRPGETASTFAATVPGLEGRAFLRTGDLGFLRDGELVVTGRIKDLIILRGRNLYPQDIERTVEGCHPSLRPGGCAAFSAEVEGGERLVVVQEVERPRRGEPSDEALAAIRAAVAEQHDVEVHSIRLIKPLGLPRTSSGKVQRHACRTAFLDGGLEVVAAWDRAAAGHAATGTPAEPVAEAPPAARSRREIARWLAERIARTLGLGPDEVDPTRPLASFGLGSVEAVGLAGDLGSLLGCPVSPLLVYDHPTIDAIAAFLGDEPATSPSARVEPPPVDPSREPIAVIGIGCRFPGAEGPSAFWSLLAEGREAIGHVPASRRSESAAEARGIPSRGGFLDDVAGFDADFFGIAPREAALIDPQHRLLLEVAWEAMEDAGLVPSKLAGSRVGVFVGVSTNDYAQIQSRRRSRADAYRVTGGAGSIAANRLSYAFDFRGPSLAVDTACSSSLVAVHLACKSLREGESTLALAGGVNLILSPEVAENFARLGFLSPDGRCKAFDARADGYVRGEGAGVVVLKPLSRALADGDPILGLIRGGAVNQDGRTNGITAPSGAAQEAVLRDAYRDAGVSPGDVAYVEAHGTGTLLGDPIEAAALGAVLAEGRPAGLPCAIGSVKTNVGHLEAAAGVAGLIKAVLSLRHGLLPPSLNFDEPNPYIPFDALGLRVPTAPEPLPAADGDGPAIVGVSSFGFGGTNAHLVLERFAAAPGEPPAADPGPFLVPISARSEESLRSLAKAVGGRLAAPDAPAIADVAATLANRREHHEHRAAIVAADCATLLDGIDAFLAGKSRPGVASGRRPAHGRPQVAFVFSGQGGLWPGVGRALAESEPAFREALEACDHALSLHGDRSLHAAFFGHDEPPATGDPGYDQPLQFAIQVAIAALWKSWGIEPDVVLGHSVGEVAAAHLAGILSLDDAARIITHRGRSMRRAAGRGRMLAAAIDAAEARERLAGRGETLSLAAINGPRSVSISGEPDAIAALAAELRAGSRAARDVDVSIAFHGPQMDGPRAELEAALSGLSPSPGAVRFVSTVTGGELRGDELDARYWGRNVREPVLFEPALRVLAAEGFRVALEVGAHPIHAAGIAASLGEGGTGPRPVVVGSLRRGEDRRSTLLDAAAALYAAGCDLDWERLAPRGRLVPLPTYPWSRAEYWLEDEPEPPAAAPSSNGHATNGHGSNGHATNGHGRLADIAAANGHAAGGDGPTLLHRLLWEPAPDRGAASPDLAGHWRILGRSAGELGRRIEEAGGTWEAGELPRRTRPDLGLRGVIDARPLDLAPASDLASIEEGHRVILGGLLEVVREIAAIDGPARPRLWIVTRGARRVVDGDPAPDLVQAPLWGFGRSLALEYPEAWGGLIDLDPAAGADVADAIAAAIREPGGDDAIAARGGRHHAARLEPIDASPTGAEGLTIRPSGTYLITGGLGDLGLAVARDLVARGARRLVLLGRTPLPPRASWQALEAGDPSAPRVAAIRELEDRGATVLTAAADAADRPSMERLLDDLARAFPPIRGVIHAAGVVRPRPATEIDEAALAETLRPKVAGGWNLHELTGGLDLDFFVLFSSVASLWGSPKQVDYAAANGFLDALAEARRTAGLPALSVNWGPWGEVGMASREGRNDAMALLGLRPLAAGPALEALDLLAGGPHAQAAVVDADWARLKSLHARDGRNRLLERMGGSPGGDGGAGRGRRADGEPLLQVVRRQLAGVLRTTPEKVDPEKTLTMLGLDSLTALEVKAGLEAELGIVLPLSLLLQGSTVGALTAAVEPLLDGDAAGTDDEPRAPGEAHAAIAATATPTLSFGQQMVWYAHQFAEGARAYNIGGAGRVRGPVDLAALRRSLGRMVSRHEAMRTAFDDSRGAPEFRLLDAREVLADEPSWFLVEDARGLDDPGIRTRIDELASRPFDLARGPLFRVHVLELGGEGHAILITFHHIVSDFWSLAVFVDELGRLYAGEREGRGDEAESALAPISHGYADFVRWQHAWLDGAPGRRSWAYWSRQLGGELPVLDLPTDRPRPAVRSQRGATLHLNLDPARTAALVELGRSRGCSLYVTILAALQVLLSRYSGQDDVIVGSPVSGRTRPDWERLIGYFVNLLPMRGDLSGNPTFEEYMGRLRRVVAEGLEHQDFPFSQLAARLQPRPDLSRSPLFQVMYIHQRAHRLDEAGLTPFSLGADGLDMVVHGLPVESLATDRHAALFDLTLTTAMRGDRLALSLEYATDLFEAGTAGRMAEGLLSLLADVAADPTRRIGDLDIVGDTQRTRMVAATAGAELPASSHETIHERFEARAALTPDAPAIVSGGDVLTYRELDRRADLLARRLAARGVGPEVVVGLLVASWPTRVVGLLGVLKAGGAYLPLDPDLPAERRAAMVEDAGASLVLTDLPPGRRDGLAGRDAMGLDGEATGGAEPAAARPARRPAGGNLAYVIFTSGSTGRAKGVMVSHASLLAAGDAWAAAYRLRQEPLRHLQAAAFSFDVFTGDWVRALTTGGTLVACPRDVLLDPPALAGLIRRERIDCLELVPAVAEALARQLQAEGRGLDGIRLLAVGSDMLRGRLYRTLVELIGPEGRVVNSYGLTEATIDSTYFEGSRFEDEEDGRVPIGRPYPGTRAYVLDAQMAPVPPGVVGELYLGGPGVARGYAGSPGATAARFVPDPFGEVPGARLYRTGDLVRWRADGNLDYLARADRQLKINGVRIEPAEIEEALLSHPAAREAVVEARDAGRGRRRLVAYATLDGPPGGRPDADELRGWLRRRLPEAMVPAALVLLDEFPLSPNGKIDRRALPDPAPEAADSEGYVAPRTPAEATLARIAEGLLEVDRVGIRDNVFAMGIDSILGIQLISRARGEGLSLSPADLFRYPTIAELAAAPGILPDASAARAQRPLESTEPFALVPDPALRERLAAGSPAEDLFPLTPVQEGILYHATASPGGGLYVEQLVCRIEGGLDEAAFREAWRRVVAHHPALRSSIAAAPDGRHYQVVRADDGSLDLPFAAEDLRGMDPSGREGRIAAFLEADQARGFDPSRPPLMRLALFRLEDAAYQLAWTIHHVVADGWSLGILLRDAIAAYGAIARGEEPAFAANRPFRDYIARLDGRAPDGAEAFWRAALRGVSGPTPLGLDGPAGDRPAHHVAGPMEEIGRALPPSVARGLNEVARAGQVTLNTVLQGAWALLLSRYAGRDDVVFGVTVAGRPAELPGMESMVGVFINTLPLRVRADDAEWLVPWLQGVQRRAAGLRPYEALPLSAIHEWSEVPPGRPLFESLLIVQNLPLAGLLGREAGRLGIRSAHYRERTHHPITITVVPGNEIDVKVGYDAGRFDREAIGSLLGQFSHLLESIAADPERRLGAFALAGELSGHAGLAGWDPGEGDGAGLAGPDDLDIDIEGLSEQELDALISELGPTSGNES
ncbi:Tyrocidine synthase 3 [Aquisphaera giovannonii]|uniref:Tyrocidine synthase 3 n=1 Tax=Aquisphaera giovannonii TaxID=406548 RepID=A0A5B9W3B6_9BACT|nr:non-ribosomal peptide synthetase/type I polyketide synthase [Aquisphaera giovannonii]QEH34734.1 Tyrocidine synthase 3 [Aquisphaera giovannonii]